MTPRSGRFGSFFAHVLEAGEDVLAEGPALLRLPVAGHGGGEGDVLRRLGEGRHRLGALLHPLPGGGAGLLGEVPDCGVELVGEHLPPEPLEGGLPLVVLLDELVDAAVEPLDLGLEAVDLVAPLDRSLGLELEPALHGVGRVVVDVLLGDLEAPLEGRRDVGLRAQLRDHRLDLCQGRPLLGLRGVRVVVHELDVGDLRALDVGLELLPGRRLGALHDEPLGVALDGAVGDLVFVHCLLLLPVYRGSLSHGGDDPDGVGELVENDELSVRLLLHDEPVLRGEARLSEPDLLLPSGLLAVSQDLRLLLVFWVLSCYAVE